MDIACKSEIISDFRSRYNESEKFVIICSNDSDKSGNLLQEQSYLPDNRTRFSLGNIRNLIKKKYFKQIKAATYRSQMKLKEPEKNNWYYWDEEEDEDSEAESEAESGVWILEDDDDEDDLEEEEECEEEELDEEEEWIEEEWYEQSEEEGEEEREE